jgi:hypothetical protein
MQSLAHGGCALAAMPVILAFAGEAFRRLRTSSAHARRAA